MIVMKPTATEEDIQSVIDRIESCGARAHPSRGEEVTVIGASATASTCSASASRATPGVQQVVPILKPYKLSSSQFRHGERTVIEIDGRRIGGEHFTMIAGPCTVESRDQTLSTAHAVAAAGASMFRGGAYKPRSSPYSFQGLGQEGLQHARRGQGRDRPADRHRADGRARRRADPRGRRRDPGRRAQHAELPAAGRDRPHGQAGADQARPVLDARGAADGGRVRPQGGQPERDAVRARHPHVRDRLPLHARHHGHPDAQGALAPAGDRRPVSHAPGRRDMVLPLSLAAAAAGADGIIVEVHPNPEEAICDGPQQIYAEAVRRATSSRSSARPRSPARS